MPKTILMSQFPLPYSRIGSWTTLYRGYLESAQNQIDIIICEKPERYFENIEYAIVEDGFGKRMMRKFSKKKHSHFIKALEKTIRPNQKYIIQIVDTHGLAKAVQAFLEANDLREQCYLQYFYHGFAPIGNQSFFERTDEVILLTQKSYEAFKAQTAIMPSSFSVLHNGIDTKKFCPVDAAQQQMLKQKFGFENKKIFVWCSQDRPKKGLKLLLNVWKRINEKHPDTALLVIGCEPKAAQKGVHFIGKVPNEKLPEYFQMSDVYLFPTLCQEGFGMSLIEALHCGCYCIASAMGGVPEALQYGQLGKLIDNPHFMSAWIDAIEDYLSGNAIKYRMPSDLYTSERWNAGMTAIINEAKINLES